MNANQRLDSQKVKEWLRKNGEKEAFLQMHLRVHFNTVRGWLENGTIPSAVHLLKLAQIMGVDPNSLLTQK